MYKEILRGIGGIDVYPVVSLIIFVTFFAIAIARALRMDARSVGQLAALPLDDSDERDALNSQDSCATGSGVTR
jgi:cytochrome c oxidase cbb3-type subunit IV